MTFFIVEWVGSASLDRVVCESLEHARTLARDETFGNERVRILRVVQTVEVPVPAEAKP